MVELLTLGEIGVQTRPDTTMTEFLTITGVVAVSWIFAWMVARVSENWIRKKAIERGASQKVVEGLFRDDDSPSRYGALKWGMVIIALGLAVCVQSVAPYDFADPVAYGVLFVFGGGALVLYYVLVGRSEERRRDGGPPRPRRGHAGPPRGGSDPADDDLGPAGGESP